MRQSAAVILSFAVLVAAPAAAKQKMPKGYWTSYYALVREGLSNADASNAAAYLYSHPNSACARMARKALAHDRNAVEWFMGNGAEQCGGNAGK